MARVDSFENVGAVGLAGDPARSADRRVGFAAGVLGAGAGLLVAFVARFGLGVPTPPELVADRILSVLPPALFEAVLQTLSVYAKPLLFATMLAFELFVGGLVGALVATRWPPARKPVGGLAIGLALAAIVLLAGLPALGYGLAGQSTRAGAGLTALTILLSGLAYGLVLSVALRYATPTLELETEAQADETDLSAHGRRRRLLLTRIAAGLFVLSGGAVIWKLVGDLGARAFSRPIKGLSPEITPVDDFYTVSKNFLDPTVDAASWKVEITGLVDQPLTLTYDDLKALPSVEKIHTLACISNPVGGDLIGNASWKGVRVKDLMAKAGVKAGAIDAVLRAADDYADSVPVAKLLESETLLVYEMNGAPLKPTHGFPARLLIPNIYGMKN
ncbi:MAG: molybdopterin-dependent oxidoreductase, partial [Chloroflexi bacterium]|nr:molybdopterin-dependent oxidoreductase [Chloroflexota bacterium]